MQREGRKHDGRGGMVGGEKVWLDGRWWNRKGAGVLLCGTGICTVSV